MDCLERLERKEYQGSKAKNKIITTKKGKSSVSLIADNPYPFFIIDIYFQCSARLGNMYKDVFFNVISRDISDLVSSYKWETPKKQKVSYLNISLLNNVVLKESASRNIKNIKIVI